MVHYVQQKPQIELRMKSLVDRHVGVMAVRSTAGHVNKLQTEAYIHCIDQCQGDVLRLRYHPKNFVQVYELRAVLLQEPAFVRYPVSNLSDAWPYHRLRLCSYCRTLRLSILGEMPSAMLPFQFLLRSILRSMKQHSDEWFAYWAKTHVLSHRAYALQSGSRNRTILIQFVEHVGLKRSPAYRATESKTSCVFLHRTDRSLCFQQHGYFGKQTNGFYRRFDRGPSSQAMSGAR